MKFKISTLIWITALLAVFVSGWATIQSERAMRQTAESKAKSAIDEMTEQHDEAVSQFRAISKKFQRIEKRAKVFKGLNAKSPAHLVWLGEPQWVDSSSKVRLSVVWDWRIFLPKGHSELEVCWAVEQIPETGFPPDSKVKRKDVVVSRMSENEAGNPLPSQWLGGAILHCELKPHKNSNVYCRVNVSPHRFDAGPFETDAFFGNGTFLPAETDWLYASQLGDYSATEPVEVDEEELRSVSFNEPHVLVRIRGKRKFGDELNEVDGPAPGFMLWLQEK